MSKIEMIVKTNGKTYEIGELVTSVSYNDKLNDGCSKLEFEYISEDIIISNGSNVWFTYDGKKIFCGFVFKYTINKSSVVSVTAYDQLRYCKAKDEIVSLGDTATSLVKRMCNYFKLRTGTISNTKYKLSTAVHDGQTWLDIIYDAIGETLQNTGKKYCLRDEFGAITLRNLEDLRLDMVLGDNSLTYDFEYEKSIDDDTYNQIKVYINGKDGGTPGKFINVKSDASIKKYGLLQFFESVESGSNEAQIVSKAQELLKLYSGETETLSIDCIGDTSIRAGSSFYLYLSSIKLNKQLFVTSVTHEFLPSHTMSIDVALYDNKGTAFNASIRTLISAPISTSVSKSTSASTSTLNTTNKVTGDNLSISKSGMDLIKRFEGNRLTAYLDPVGIWTIGVGHTGTVDGRPVSSGMRITAEKSDLILQQDARRFEKQVNKYQKKYRFTQNEFDALVSFAFNIGSIDGLTAGGTRTKTQIKNAMLLYCKAGGRTLAGLEQRRKAEAALFAGG